MALVACDSEKEASPAEVLARRVDNLDGQCRVPPASAPNFQPAQEWAWTGSTTVLPDHKQVMMTPVVVDLNQDGTPDVVFNAFAGSNYRDNGVLRALNGATGEELWAVTDATLRVRGSAQLAAGDIDGDGQVELCTIPESGTGVLCFEHDGSFKFRTPESTNNWGGPSLADLDGDGSVEILNGNHVFSATGALKWVGSDGTGGHGTQGPLSFAADLDGDGLQEVINGRAIYQHDGTLRCTGADVGQGLAAVGNFDADAQGEVVVVAGGRVVLMDDTCEQKWSVSVPGGGTGGAPTVADFDNDGQPEIGVAGSIRYVVFETNGTVKWSSPTQDSGSGMTSSAAFDFDGDGQTEVVYADETKLRIYNGATGAVRMELAHSSATTYENPVIVDVDGDGRAELVLASNTGSSSGAGLRAYREANDRWVNTRPLWNQHAYSVTNVNDDGTVPAEPARNWSTPGLNTFRANSLVGPSPYAAADLTVTELAVACGPAAGQVRLVATVHNAGDADAPEGLPVAFYRGEPGAGGELLGVASLSAALPSGQSQPVGLTVSPSQETAAFFARADDDGSGAGVATECLEDNNTLSRSLVPWCDSDNLPPVALCQAVTVPADAVTCQATAPSVDNGSHDPDHGPQPLSLSQSPTGPLGLGSHDITLTASDGEASAVCVAQVKVVDVTPPTLTLVGEASVTVECGSPLPLEVEASDSCEGDLTSRVQVLNFNSQAPGFQTVTHRVADNAGNTTEGATRYVTVQDTSKPTVAMNGEATMVLECGVDTYVDPGAVGHDACSGPLPVRKYNSGDDDGDGVPGAEDPDDFGPGPNGKAVGTYSVQYKVIDAVWLEANAIRTVKVQDTLPPSLKLNGEAQMTVTRGEEFVDPWATATDACYGDVTPSVVREGSVDTQTPGTYVLTYKVSDSTLINAAPVQRTVEVVEAQATATATKQ